MSAAPKTYHAIYVQRVQHKVEAKEIAEAHLYAKKYAADHGLMLVCIHDSKLPCPLAPM